MMKNIWGKVTAHTRSIFRKYSTIWLEIKIKEISQQSHVTYCFYGLLDIRVAKMFRICQRGGYNLTLKFFLTQGVKTKISRIIK